MDETFVKARAYLAQNYSDPELLLQTYAATLALAALIFPLFLNRRPV